MSMNLTPEEQILQATRQSLREEIARREEAELQLELLHKAVSEYVYMHNTYNKTLLDSVMRANEYLKSVGIIK